jgi:hypothetical protein
LGAAAEPLASTFAALTPPFPLNWPPNGEWTAVYFAYTRVPLPTSTDLYEVQTPFLRITVGLDAAGAAKSSVARLTPKPAKFSEAGGAIDPSSETMERAAEVLFDVVCLKSGAPAEPAGAAATTLRSAYRTWLREHQSVGNEMRLTFPAFVAWVESNQ